MKIHFFFIMVVALLVSGAPSEARARKRPGNPQAGGPTAEAPAKSDSRGGPSSNRGISNAESLAISAVLKQAAGARAATGDEAVPAPRSGRYSPDYYRVYAQRHQMSAGTRRVAVATPAPATPTPATPGAAKRGRFSFAPRVAVPTPVPVQPAVVKPSRVAVAPRVAVATPPPVKPMRTKPTRVAVAPTPVKPAPVKASRVAVTPPVPRTPVPPKPTRVAVAPRVAMAPPAPAKPIPAKPTRVAVAPRVAAPAPVPTAPVIARPIRVAVAPPAPVSVKAKKEQKAAGVAGTPTRVLFR